MKDFTPTSLPPMPGREVPRLPPVEEDSGPRAPRFEPAEHRFPIELGDGQRAWLPPSLVDGIGMPESELTFTARQHTISEMCRCFRLATVAEHLNTVELENQIMRSAIRSIGTNLSPSDAAIDRWISDIGPQGFKYVNELIGRLTGISKYMSDLYMTSYRPDRAKRRHNYTVPPVCLPVKRWAARTGLPAKWHFEVTEEKIDKSHWLVDGAAPDIDVQSRLNRDLSFVMTEITVAQENSIADLADDPDDTHAVRILSTMLAIVEIGGRPLGDSPADMEEKLIWLEDIGPRARLLVTGTYAKLHEVDRVELSRFLASAESLE